MIRAVALVVALLAFVGVAALDDPTPGGAPAAGATDASDPRVLPSACPGPQTVPVGDVSTGDSELDAGSDDVTLETLPEGGLEVGSGIAFSTDAGGGPAVGVAVERIGTGDLAGLAGLTCMPVATDQWLVGGATTLGSSARLVLTNPGATSVRASVQLHTPVGPVEGATSIIVGPGAQESVLLEALETEMPATAVHITAGGLGVSAAVQDSRLDGFTAAGTDWIVASAGGTSLVAALPGPSDGAGSALLSLVAPEGADVTLALETADGDQGWLGEPTLTLEPGVVTDVPIPAADHGFVTIEADAPVVAGTRVSLTRPLETGDGTPARDHAWSASQPAGDARARASVVPPGEVSLLVRAGAGGTLTADGAPLDAPAAGASLVPLDLEPGTVIASEGAVDWLLVVEDQPGFITTLEPVSTALASEEIAVVVGGYLPAS